MATATIDIEFTSHYCQGRAYELVKLSNTEKHDALEERTWRERAHVNDDGFVVMPAATLKRCLEETSQYLGLKIPGQRNKTYSSKFRAGIIVLEDHVFPFTKNDLLPDRRFVPSDGKVGGGSRVWKNFPVIPKGSKARFQIHILDDSITEDVLRMHLEQAGILIGVGVWRPIKGGQNGRFRVTLKDWKA
jgi:hypothetical protein